MFDLLNYVDATVWESNRLETDNSGRERTSLEYGGARNDEIGFVNFWPNSLNEFGEERGDYLVTRPKGGDRGTIRGVFPPIVLLANSVFHASVGFLHETPESSGVVFQVWVHYQHEGRSLSHRISSLFKERNGRLDAISIDLSFLAGRSVQLELRVDTGLHPHALDLPVWSNPRVEVLTSPLLQPARYFEIRPTELTVNQRHERSGGGDDPFIGLLYFRSSVGVKGSTMVEVLDLLQLLGANVSEGGTITIDETAFMIVRDIGFQQGIITLMSAVFVAGEEDKIGRAVFRTKLKEAADRTALYLANTAERDPAGVISNFELFVENLRDAAEGPPSEGGAGGFGRWIGRAHDLIGINAVSLVSGSGEDLVPLNPDSQNYPVGLLEDRDFLLHYNGEGADWTLRIEVRLVGPSQILSGNPTIPRSEI